jgi:hypothetical protein
MTEREPRQSDRPSPEPSSPFTSGTVTVGYPFEEQEREELERLEEAATRDSNGSVGQ